MEEGCATVDMYMYVDTYVKGLKERSTSLKLDNFRVIERSQRRSLMLGEEVHDYGKQEGNAGGRSSLSSRGCPEICSHV